MQPSPGLQTAGGAISPSLSSSASRLSSSARLLVSEPDPVVSILLLPHSQITKDPDQGLPTLPEDISPALEKAVRTVKYTFPRRFLRFDTIRTALVFAVLAVIVAVTLPFSHAVVGLTTSDATVVRDGARVLPAALVATLLGVLNSLCTGGVFSGQGRQSLVAALSFCLDIPLSIGGVAAVVLLVKGARLLDVYWYQTAAALVELLVAYAFVFASDWKRYADEALARQAAR